MCLEKCDRKEKSVRQHERATARKCLRDTAIWRRKQSVFAKVGDLLKMIGGHCNRRIGMSARVKMSASDAHSAGRSER